MEEKNELYERFVHLLKNNDYISALGILQNLATWSKQKRLLIHGNIFEPYIPAVYTRRPFKF